MPDRSHRTEQATPRRLEKARREGQFLVSKEFVGALQFLVFVASLSWVGAEWYAGTRDALRLLIKHAFSAELHPAQLVRLSWQVAGLAVLPFGKIAAAMLGVTLAAQLTVTRMGL